MRGTPSAHLGVLWRGAILLAAHSLLPLAQVIDARVGDGSDSELATVARRSALAGGATPSGTDAAPDPCLPPMGLTMPTLIGPRTFHPAVRSAREVQRFEYDDRHIFRFWRYFSLLDVPPTSRLASEGRREFWVFARNGQERHSRIRPRTELFVLPTARGALVNRSHRAAKSLPVHRGEGINFGATLSADGASVLAAAGLVNHQVHHGRVEAVPYQNGTAILSAAAPGRALADRHRVAWRRTSRFLADDLRRMGCHENRQGFAACNTDSKFSLVAHRGQVLVYARANISPEPGTGRFVQVTRARSPAGPWSAFDLVRIPGYDAAANNVYLGVFNVNPVDPDTVVGLFAMSGAPKDELTRPWGAIRLAVSCDGVRFSRAETLATSFQAREGRATDHPVDGIVHDGDDVLLFLHTNVPGVRRSFTRPVPRRRRGTEAPPALRPAILSLAIGVDEFRALTARLKEGLPGCG